MRILHVIECFAAGTVQFVNLATRHIAGHEHIVLHGERKEEISATEVKLKFPKHVHFIKWQSAQREISPVYDYRALRELQKHIKVLKPDVIHLHSSKAGFLGRVASFFSGFKNVIYTPHGASFLRKDVSPAKIKVYSGLEKIASMLSGQVICCSKSESEAFKRLSIKAEYINNGISIGTSVVPSTQSTLAREIIVITCSRITEQKNPYLFNKIAEAFITEPNVKFIWVGEGELRHELTAPNIHVTGWVTPDEVKRLLETANLYLATSLWEGLPFSVLEAMSLGKCLLLSDCVGHTDVVDYGQNGFIFNSAEEAIEKIIALKANKEHLINMGKQSLEICKRDFDIRSTYAAYLEAYKAGSKIM